MKAMLAIIKFLWTSVLGKVLLLVVIVGIYVTMSEIFPAVKFWKGKPEKMLDAAVVVDRIRDVEKLLTADFYGEIYADLEEVYLGLDPVYRKLKEYKRGNEVIFTKLDTIYLDVLRNLFSDDEWNKINGKDTIWIDHTKKTKYVRVFQGSFFNRQTKLVMIGRGWIKAGFNLEDLSEDSLNIDRATNTIRIILPDPAILYADINPYFDFEKEIPGFEIFLTERIKNIDDYDTKAVKALCKYKLLHDALDKKILVRAEDSGKKTLERLLMLLGYDEVIFVDSFTDA